jgi:sugar/nucleoside kinase (ribokinase family)
VPPSAAVATSTTYIVVGDAMIDITVRMGGPLAYGSDTPASITQSPGGSAANTAAWLASTGQATVFVGCVGDDAPGREVRSALLAAGVQPALSVAPAPTGACVVLVDPTGQRTMLPDTGANAHLDPTAADPFLGPHAHLHVSGYALMHDTTADPVLRLIERARAAGSTISVDPASAQPLADGAPWVTAALDLADVILANEDEARVLVGRPDPSPLGRPAATVVVKRGPEGVLARRGTERVERPARDCAVVDTTGAGDAFTAGFLPAWRSGASLTDALDAGQVLAAQVVGRVGTRPPAA